MSANNMSGPQRVNKIIRYKPPSTEANPTLEDPTPDYMNLLGMIFSMCGLMLKLKWCAWIAVYCSFISFANSRSSEDTKQMMSSFMLSISAVVMSYLQNPHGRWTPDSPTDHLGEREREGWMAGERRWMDGDREGEGKKMDVLRGNTMVDMRQDDQVVLVITPCLLSKISLFLEILHVFY
uniref:PAT complex subunit Asterix n=1 Tax=Salmo trutta TaxID=8032 RepID=A0A674BJ76_SALTR